MFAVDVLTGPYNVNIIALWNYVQVFISWEVQAYVLIASYQNQNTHLLLVLSIKLLINARKWILFIYRCYRFGGAGYVHHQDTPKSVFRNNF